MDSVGTEIALYFRDSTPSVIYRQRMVHESVGFSFSTVTAMRYVVADNGNVYIANVDYKEYAITCFSPSGDSLFTFFREGYSPVKLPNEVIQ